jgi:hypothetical protein
MPKVRYRFSRLSKVLVVGGTARGPESIRSDAMSLT